MSKMFAAVRIARNTLIAMALAASPMLVSAQAAAPVSATARVDAARVQIEEIAKHFNVPPEKISYAGVDGKRIPAAAFYGALLADPKQEYEGSGTMEFPSNSNDKPKDFVIKLSPKDKQA
jgi:hypothetical protein